VAVVLLDNLGIHTVRGSIKLRELMLHLFQKKSCLGGVEGEAITL